MVCLKHAATLYYKVLHDKEFRRGAAGRPKKGISAPGQIPAQRYARKMIDAGLPTGVYWPVKVSAPVIGSIRKVVMASANWLHT